MRDGQSAKTPSGRLGLSSCFRLAFTYGTPTEPGRPFLLRAFEPLRDMQRAFPWLASIIEEWHCEPGFLKGVQRGPTELVQRNAV